jgi:hypothetical protein
MAYYGSGADIRSDISGGVREGHQQFLTIEKLTDDLIERGRRFAYRRVNSILEPTFGDVIPYASGSEPDILFEYSNTIAAWWIQNRRFPDRSSDENPFNTEYAEAIKDLEEMAKTGKGLGNEAPTKTSAYFSHSNMTPVFDVDDVKNQDVDSDLLDRIADDRV